MKIRNRDAAESALSQGHVIVETRQPAGTTFGLENGAAVPKNVVQQLQGDLFVVPSEDGLFPGHSQTFRMLTPTEEK